MNVPTQPLKISRELLNIVQIMLGIFSAGMGIDGFLLSSNFIDGGVTGVSMLLSKVTGIPLSVWLPLVNLPFIALGYRQIGRAFAIRSVLAIAFLALVLAVVPFPDVTSDLTLTAVFGGFFIGAGIGLAVRGGAVLDGTEIAALILSKHSHLFKVGDLILGFNIVLFLLAMTVLSVEQALYSILTYVAAAKTLDFVIYGVDELTAITIISEQNAAIRASITETLGRGVTVYRGYGGKSGAEQNILYCVVTRLEIGRIKTLIRSIDPRAFVVVHALSSAEGGVIKQSNNH
jgi:uncharacterized membrane-anchored protein YitT (DUF2179 family)